MNLIFGSWIFVSMVLCSVVDPLNPDPDPALQVNPVSYLDPGFHNQKFQKTTAEKK
jgi:hypothetical protein